MLLQRLVLRVLFLPFMQSMIVISGEPGKDSLIKGLERMAQGLRVLAAFAEHLKSVPGTHLVILVFPVLSAVGEPTPSCGLCGH